jgi:hypothetical protein
MQVGRRRFWVVGSSQREGCRRHRLSTFRKSLPASTAASCCLALLDIQLLIVFTLTRCPSPYRCEARFVTIDQLIIKLQRLGYPTQTFGDHIIVELDDHSKVRGSVEQIERVLPTLERPTRAETIGRQRFEKKRLRRIHKRQIATVRRQPPARTNMKFRGVYVVRCKSCGWQADARKPHTIEKLKNSHTLNCSDAQFAIQTYPFTVPPPSVPTDIRSKLAKLAQRDPRSRTRRKKVTPSLPEVYPAEN